MTDSLRVRVVEFGDRKHYQLQWTCPLSGRKKTKSSGIERTGKKRERDAAMKAAGDLEQKLAAGELASGAKLSWEQFRDRYENEVCKAKAENTAVKVSGVFNLVEKILNPTKLAHLTAERLSYFQSELRKAGKAESSIKSTLAHLKAALRWAGRLRLLVVVPAIEMPKRAGDRMKGRPITGEEFDRMIAAVDKLASGPEAAVWKRFLRGLWLSGLRISEAVALTWDGSDGMRVDMTGRRPMLVIAASQEKGHKNRLLPITPDFAAMLAETPEAERRGRVFRLPAMSRSAASHFVADVGKQAGVKVSETPKGTKFASAHDLRRSFGERWAARVMPAVLMELMRHDHITTTMSFYVGRNAERTADAVWEAAEKNGNTFGNTSSESKSQRETLNAATTDATTS